MRVDSFFDNARLITPHIHSDERGEFFRFYCSKEFEQFTSSKFVQMNQSVNPKKGTLRGIHYQEPPFSEEKIVRCTQGEIWDVIVDLRKNSKTFLQWKGVFLNDQNNQILYIPAGFGHGFITLKSNTVVQYQHSEFYSPEYENGIYFNDPVLNIEWPEKVNLISERDQKLQQITSNFKGINIL